MYFCYFVLESRKIKSDTAWKFILKALFEDFVEFFMPDLYTLVDFSIKPRFLDQEFEELFPESKGENRKVDKLVELKLKDGTEKLILVHAEIQSYYDNEFEKRMFDYFIRIFDHYQKDIDAIAIFTYEGNAHKGKKYEKKFLKTKIVYSYRTYDISKQNEKKLLKSSNPFAMVAYIAKKAMNHEDNDISNYNFKKELTEMLLKKGYNRDRIIGVFKFLSYIFGIKDEALRDKLRKEVIEMALREQVLELTDFEESAINEGIQKGEAIGIQKGKLETNRERLKRLLTKKFKSISDEMISKIDNCDDIVKLETTIDNIFDYTQANDVLDILK